MEGTEKGGGRVEEIAVLWSFMDQVSGDGSFSGEIKVTLL
jgi:hypothetical protein